MKNESPYHINIGHRNKVRKIQLASCRSVHDFMAHIVSSFNLQDQKVKGFVDQDGIFQKILKHLIIYVYKRYIFQQ